MADEEQLRILKQGPEAWNAWRQAQPDRRPDLREANISKANLRGAALREADLIRANLVGTDLREANLRGADLIGADLREADLREADLTSSPSDSGFQLTVGATPKSPPWLPLTAD
jgi:hypothetical protein